MSNVAIENSFCLCRSELTSHNLKIEMCVSFSVRVCVCTYVCICVCVVCVVCALLQLTEGRKQMSLKEEIHPKWSVSCRTKPSMVVMSGKHTSATNQANFKLHK